MLDLNGLKKAHSELTRRYNEILAQLSSSKENFSEAAQLANDTYLELKKVERELKDCSILNQLEQLFGC